MRVDTPTRLSSWSRELGKNFRESSVRHKQEELNKQFGVQSLDDFRRMLIGRFGSLIAAWRCIFDPDSIGWLTFGQFRDGLDRLGGFRNSTKKIWDALDSKVEGQVSLHDLDEVACELLESLRAALVGKFGNLARAWSRLDHGGSGLVDEDTFKECAGSAELGLHPGELHTIFRLLLPNHRTGQTKLQEQDLRALLLIVPAHDRTRVWSGAPNDQDVPPADPVGKSLMSTYMSVPLEPSAIIAYDNELKQHTPQDFNRLLVSHFGGIYAGWIKYFDVTQKGRVPLGEFVQRSRAIGVAGNVHALFKSIDQAGRGFVTLRDLDPEVAAAVEEFLQLAEDRYGSIPQAFRNFDNTGKGRVDEEDFQRGCAALGYTGDARRLFAFLRPECGRHFLFPEDLGPKASRFSHPSPPVSPSSAGKRRDGKPPGPEKHFGPPMTILPAPPSPRPAQAAGTDQPAAEADAGT